VIVLIDIVLLFSSIVVVDTRQPKEAMGIGRDERGKLLISSATPSSLTHNSNYNYNYNYNYNQAEVITCEVYNDTVCEHNPDDPHCRGTQECQPREPDKPALCYALWQNTSTHGFVPKLKGCWVGSINNCVEKSRCVETRKDPKKQLFFCCCEDQLCNRNITHIPDNEPPAKTPSDRNLSTPVLTQDAQVPVSRIILLSLVPAVTLLVLIGVIYYIYRYRKNGPYFNEVPTSEPSCGSMPPSPYIGFEPKLVELKAQGRFGNVWKARVGTIPEDYVAVKIFPPQDRDSWMTEQQIYRLPQMRHENLLAFLGTLKKGDGLNSEFWLITEYQERGSLADYLKANLVTWPELLSIADGIAKGLTHLHEEIPEYKLEGFKPSIAHRDFKSKNVLIRADMTACIADFGLALVFYPNIIPGESQCQVGTRRYMAPEVLEGAINFSRDAFLRIDMYACGLVLWELMSRCSAQDGPVGEYMLPFEEEIGQHPTLEDMQEVVSQQKKRPQFKDTWRKHSGMNALCDTVEDCWDHDAEARLSASCVGERITALIRNFAGDFYNLNSSLNSNSGYEMKVAYNWSDDSRRSVSTYIIKETST